MTAEGKDDGYSVSLQKRHTMSVATYATYYRQPPITINKVAALPTDKHRMCASTRTCAFCVKSRTASAKLGGFGG